METLVLCPEELCLGPAKPVAPPAGPFAGLTPITTCNYSIWTSGDLEKGTRFLPWKGTVRSDKLPVHDKLPEFDVSPINTNDVLQQFHISLEIIVVAYILRIFKNDLLQQCSSAFKNKFDNT